LQKRQTFTLIWLEKCSQRFNLVTHICISQCNPFGKELSALILIKMAERSKPKSAKRSFASKMSSYLFLIEFTARNGLITRKHSFRCNLTWFNSAVFILQHKYDSSQLIASFDDVILDVLLNGAAEINIFLFSARLSKIEMARGRTLIRNLLLWTLTGATFLPSDNRPWKSYKSKLFIIDQKFHVRIQWIFEIEGFNSNAAIINFHYLATMIDKLSTITRVPELVNLLLEFRQI
jgi:hypothetical protein